MRWLVISVLVTGLLGCQGEDRLRTEARKFLLLHAAVPYGGEVAARDARVRALEQAVFSEEDVKRVRDLCVSGHRTLLAQEAAQESNARAIEDAIRTHPGDAPLPPETVARLKQQLATSESELGKARDMLGECEAQARSLELRFGKR